MPLLILGRKNLQGRNTLAYFSDALGTKYKTVLLHLQLERTLLNF
jgi:hypothetical protein